MARERNAPTMADVAREAGVALGTVSRVVNGQPVGAEFKARVDAAIQKLGYRYNSSGRVLRTDRTNTVALIIPNTINPYFALLVHHVNMALEKRDYEMLLCFTEYDRRDACLVESLDIVDAGHTARGDEVQLRVGFHHLAV